MAEVEARGGAFDAARVCGAVWAKKSARDKRAILALDKGPVMASKKKNKTKKKTERKKTGAKPRTTAVTTRKAPAARSPSKRPKKKARSGPRRHARCLACGHTHAGPCVHMEGSSVCPCNRPVHHRRAA
jgi:hypothetical protein